MVYICPIGSRGGMNYLFFEKSVFVKHPNEHTSQCHRIRQQTPKNSCTRKIFFRQILRFQIVLYGGWDGGSYKKNQKN